MAWTYGVRWVTLALMDSIDAAEGGAILWREGNTLNMFEHNELDKKNDQGITCVGEETTGVIACAWIEESLSNNLNGMPADLRDWASVKPLMKVGKPQVKWFNCWMLTIMLQVFQRTQVDPCKIYILLGAWKSFQISHKSSGLCLRAGRESSGSQ